MKISKKVQFTMLALAVVFPISFARAEVCNPFSNTYFSGPNTLLQDGGNAVLTYTSPLWTTAIPGSQWVWKSENVANPDQEDSETFLVKVNLPSDSSTATLKLAADDYFRITVNGNEIASENNEGNFIESNSHTYDLTSHFKKGESTLLITITNAAYFYQGEGTPFNNPAGVLYRLDIHGLECISTPTIGSGGGSSSESYIYSTNFTNGTSTDHLSVTNIGADLPAAASPVLVSVITEETKNGVRTQDITAPSLMEEVDEAGVLGAVNFETPQHMGWIHYVKYTIIAMFIFCGVVLTFIIVIQKWRSNPFTYRFLVTITTLALVSIVLVGLIVSIGSKLVPHITVLTLVCMATYIFIYGKKA